MAGRAGGGGGGGKERAGYFPKDFADVLEYSAKSALHLAGSGAKSINIF